MADDSLKVAIKSLRKCYKKDGIVAGATHFHYYWARDSFFASWGALELGDHEIVKKNLETFIKYQKDDGQIAIRIGASSLSQWIAIFGIKNKIKEVAEYHQDKGLNPPIDPNLIFLITFEKYVTKTKNHGFTKKHIKSIHKAMDWLEAHEKEGMIYGGKYSTWQDAIKKVGFCLYTNVLYYETIKSLNKIMDSINMKNEFFEKSEIVKKKINEKFYDERKGYYIDFYTEKNRCEVFSPDGNFFAILFDIADKKASESILKKAEELGISKDTPSYTNSPNYKKSEVYFPFYLANMHGYHNHDICWPWIGCIHAMALKKTKQENKAKKILDKISKLIEKDKEVYEIYESNGKLVKRLFYKSEKEFAWGASFFILMHNTINNGKRNN